MLRAITRLLIPATLSFFVCACNDFTLVAGGHSYTQDTDDDNPSPTPTATPAPTPTPKPDTDGDGVPNFEDCDPTNPDVFQDNPEVCDGIDNNCNGLIDEGETHTFYPDQDGDGYGTNDNTVVGCVPPTGYARNRGDC